MFITTFYIDTSRFQTASRHFLKIVDVQKVARKQTKTANGGEEEAKRDRRGFIKLYEKDKQCEIEAI